MPSPHTKTYTLPEQIAAKLGDAIVAGSYSPGVWIREQSLADLFSVSRGPIRDALRILEMEGLIQIHPRRGVVVTELSKAGVADVFQIQAALLGLAARLTAALGSSEVRERFSDTLLKIDRLTSKGDASEFAQHAVELCLLLGESSANERLQEMLVSMSRQVLPLARRAVAIKQNRKVWASNWRAIVSSILAGDPDEAERGAKRLIGDVGNCAAVFASPGERHDAPPTQALAARPAVKAMPRAVKHEDVGDAGGEQQTSMKDMLAAVRGDRIRIMPSGSSNVDVDNLHRSEVVMGGGDEQRRRGRKPTFRSS